MSAVTHRRAVMGAVFVLISLPLVLALGEVA